MKIISSASTPEFIPKDTIPFIQFSREDALLLASERQRRLQDLTQAAAMGVGYQGRVKVVFKTENNKLRRFYTTVRYVGQDHITLLGGTSMPIRAIVSVRFF